MWGYNRPIVAFRQQPMSRLMLPYLLIEVVDELWIIFAELEAVDNHEAAFSLNFDFSFKICR